MEKLKWEIDNGNYKAVGCHLYMIEPADKELFILTVEAPNGALVIDFAFMKLESAMMVAELMENG
jgi:hypothetical protein